MTFLFYPTISLTKGNGRNLAVLYNLSLDELIEFDIDIKEIQEAIDKTNETVSKKVDWTKAWSTKYPILTTYQDTVEIKYYYRELEKLVEDLKIKYQYDDLNAFLVLKDILSKVWTSKTEDHI